MDKIKCELRYFMAQQKKIKEKKNASHIFQALFLLKAY